jgi:hypothetical protein
MHIYIYVYKVQITALEWARSMGRSTITRELELAGRVQDQITGFFIYKYIYIYVWMYAYMLCVYIYMFAK